MKSPTKEAIDFGKKMKELRLEAGLSQRAICKDLKLSSGTVSSYEAGKYLPRKERQDKIIAYLTSKKKGSESIWKTPEEKPEVIEDKPEPDRFGPHKNHEGYPDPTAAAALKMTEKYNNPLPGEIWSNRRNNGNLVRKLILTIHGNRALCVSCFYESSSDTVKIKSKSGKTVFVCLSFVDPIPLGNLERRTDVIDDHYISELHKAFCDYLGFSVIEKVVEVPVEKIVEVPVEKSEGTVDFHAIKHKLELKTQEARIYKEVLDKLLEVRAYDY